DEIEHGRGRVAILGGRGHAGRFVEKEVSRALVVADREPVHLDLRLRRVDDLADRRPPSVHPDAARGDQPLARPPRGDAGRREDPLEALLRHQETSSISMSTGGPRAASRSAISSSWISRAARSTSSGGSSSRLVNPKRSRNSKPVPYRNGRPGASDRPSS